MIEVLIGLAMAILLVLVLWWQNHGWVPPKSKQTESGEPFCAWCAWRSGDDCTNPDSPVGGRECGPVCVGDAQCAVRYAGGRYVG